MTDLEKQLIDLTKKWYNYVSIDHHKDRDCHWYIEKRYSYGEPAKYTAVHHGYIVESWSSLPVDNEEDAMLLLINKITREIMDAIKGIKMDLENVRENPNDSFYSAEEYEAQLKVLEA
jgi:hypothetical protein